MSKRDGRNMIILILCFVVAGMAVNFSYLQSSFNVTGSSSEVSTKWDVSIEKIAICTGVDEANDSRCGTINGTAKAIVNGTKIDTTDKLKAYFEASLPTVGDSITFKVTVRNDGTFDAKLSDIKFDKTADTTLPIAFSYLNAAEGDVILAGDTKDIYVRISYLEMIPASNATVNNSINLTYVSID